MTHQGIFPGLGRRRRTVGEASVPGDIRRMGKLTNRVNSQEKTIMLEIQTI